MGSRRWVCPKCESFILGPERAPLDSLVRFCLPCSTKRGRLVSRTIPALEEKRAEAFTARKRRAKKAAEIKREAAAEARGRAMLANARDTLPPAEARVEAWECERCGGSYTDADDIRQHKGIASRHACQERRCQAKAPAGCRSKAGPSGLCSWHQKIAEDYAPRPPTVAELVESLEDGSTSDDW